MTERVVDDFSDAARFSLIASGQAQVKVTSEASGGNCALRIDYDFHGGGGFLGVHQDLSLRMPPISTMQFRLRGSLGGNHLEFKLTDRSRRNVWRWMEKDCEISDEGRLFALRDREIEYAWGPMGGGRPERIGGVEFVISAGPGGAGTFWIEDFSLIDRTPQGSPEISASSSTRGSVPASVLSSQGGLWKPKADDRQPWLMIDFHETMEYGGLVIDWDAPRDMKGLRVEASQDGRRWQTVARAREVEGERSFVPLPNGESRFLRLQLDAPSGVRRVEVQAFEFSKTKDDLLFAVAAGSPKGDYPRYLLRRQSYWTSAGLPDGNTCALINEEGLVEPDKGTFSLEPFLWLGKQFFTWADVKTNVHLERGGLPIPTARWTLPEATFDITPIATRTEELPQGLCLIRYRMSNHSQQRMKGALLIAARPHQVTPPWQSWKGIGGAATISDLKWASGGLSISGNKMVVPLADDVECGVGAFAQGSLVEVLKSGRLPARQRVQDDSGLASGAMRFAFSLPAEGTQEFFVAVPFGDDGLSASQIRALKKLDGAEAFAAAHANWETRLEQVAFDVPAGLLKKGATAFRTAAGQILAHRDGPALQPGPRRYTRSWIRDGVLMAAALLRAGESTAPVEFIRWFAEFQREDGFVPCCVDRNGPDWLVEHDSHGQLIYGALEAYRFTHDTQLLRELWPSMVRAADYLNVLRRQRLTSEYSKGELLSRRGLLPESVSHEGYLAQPVHAYWDDFWALRGLRDAAAAAEILALPDVAKQYREDAAEFEGHLRESLKRVIAEKNLQFVPGSVEWADFDATATANAVLLLGEGSPLPVEPLRKMFRQFVTDVKKRRRGEFPWNNYTAYEVRIVGALVRLGMREEALELLDFYLSERRPLRWNQWPEISWRHPRSPGHLGDVPHTWIAAEFMLSFATLLIFEQEPEGSLVVGAGVDPAWLAAPRGLGLRGFPTRHGVTNVKLKLEGRGKYRIQLTGEVPCPPGGFVLRLPWSAPPKRVTCNGTRLLDVDPKEIRLMFDLPLDILVEC